MPPRALPLSSRPLSQLLSLRAAPQPIQDCRKDREPRRRGLIARVKRDGSVEKNPRDETRCFRDRLQMPPRRGPTSRAQPQQANPIKPGARFPGTTPDELPSDPQENPRELAQFPKR